MANDSKGDGPDGGSAIETTSQVEEQKNKLEEESTSGVDTESPNTSPKNQESTSPSETPPAEEVDFKVIYNKKKYDITFPIDSDVGALKSHLQTLIGIPPAMMKVMIKGLAKDEMPLRKLGVTKGSKVMVVGSSLNDVLKVSTKDAAAAAAADLSEDASKEEKLTTCKLKQHKRILDMGKPDDAMVGIKGIQHPLPATPLTGMLNKVGGKVRLTFKQELDQVWIGTKERTEKVNLNSIKNVVSEPIESNEEYHILALQLGPTEQSRYWIYWVPAQYIEAIKDSILGKWQFY